MDHSLAKVDHGDPAIPDLTYAYDSLGRLATFTDGQGTTTHAYHPLTSGTHGAGQLASVNGPWAHDTMAYTYDVLGRPSAREIKNDSGAILQSESFTYDALGRLQALTNDLGTHTTTYDAANRPTANVTRLPGQSTAFLTRSFEWNAQSRLTALRNRQGSAASTVLSDFGYEYSTAGDLTRWHRTLGAGNVSDWHLESDPLGQLTALTEKNTAGAVTKTWGWAYDASGNRTHEVEGTAMRLAAIGGANRLDQIGGAGNALFEGTLDEPGEVTVNGAPATVRALPGGEHHLFSKELALGAGTHQVQIQATDPSQNTTLKTYAVTVGGVERTLTYDTNGNLIREAVAGGNTRAFEWDALNRLTAIQSEAAPVDGSWRTEMTYDGQSRRVRIVEKIRSGSAWTTQSDHRYLWEGTTIVQKRDATGSTVTAKYFDQGEIRASTPYHFSRDHLGSVREVVANNGTVTARFDYTAWGERSTVSGGSFELEWGFTGHHYHAKGGLHLSMFRAYDANLGRWLSEDPIGEAGGLNLYKYVQNAPASAIDPFGLDLKWALGPGGTEAMLAQAKRDWDAAKAVRHKDGSETRCGKRMAWLESPSNPRTTTISVGLHEKNEVDFQQNLAAFSSGADATILFNPTITTPLADFAPRDAQSVLAHEACHASDINRGELPKERRTQEKSATPRENEHRFARGVRQRKKYGQWDVQQFSLVNGSLWPTVGNW